MITTHFQKPTHANRTTRRLLVFAALAFLSAACMMPTIIPSFLQPTSTRSNTVEWCETSGPTISTYIDLIEIDPGQAAPGGEVAVTGQGTYVMSGCGPSSTHKLSWGSYAVYFDGRWAAEMECHADDCEARLTVPEGMAPGTHTLSTDYGASIDILVVEPEAVAPTASATVSGCAAGETAEMVWPVLAELQPARAAPGGAVKVIGSGGYVRCGEAGYNESARSFQLYFDGKPAAQLSCYVNHCEVEFTVPGDASPGVHAISVEGGSSLSVEITSP